MVVNAMRGTKFVLYSSYAEAIAQCGPGYEDGQFAKVIIEKNKVLKRQLLGPNGNDRIGTRILDLSGVARTMIGISLAAKQTTMNVLDFGGGGGNHYIVAQALLGDRIDFRWNVVETNALVTQAKSLEDGRLKFFNNIDDAAADLGRIDLAFSSGAFQYCPDPLQSLKSFLDVGAESLYITRVGLASAGTFITLQNSSLSDNGPGPLPEGFIDQRIVYPVTLVDINEFSNLIASFYTLEAFFFEDSNAYKVEGQPMSMYGYHGKLRRR